MNQKFKIVVPAAVVAMLLLNSVLHAQPLKLSFDQAWELAQKNNAQIQNAQIGLEKAKAQIGEAYSAALPSLSASAYYQRNFIIPEMEVDFGGSKQKISFTERNMLNASVELSQPIYAAGRVGMALKIAKLYRKVSEEQIKLTDAQVKLTVTQLYFGSVVAQEWEKVAKQTYQQMQEHLQKVASMNREGLVSEYDLIRSQVQVSNFYPQVIGSESARKISAEALNVTLGLPKNQEHELTDAMEAYPAPNLPSDDLLTIALQRRSELKQMELQQGILAQLKTIEAHGVIWPNLALVGAYTASSQGPEFEFADYWWQKNLYAGLALSIPIFDGFKAKYRVQQVRADIKTLNIQKDQVERGINLEIIQGKSKLEEAQKNVKAQLEGVDLAKRGMQIAEVQYANGLATQLEVMDAQIALNQAQMNSLSAKYDLITAQAELEKAIGGN
ncbi:MAG: TolC family protein [bacterium]|nr:TolC family protein [bacterium]